MENNIEKILTNFIDDSVKEEKDKNLDAKKIIIEERSGLIERIDRQYVTNDGRILLREQY